MDDLQSTSSALVEDEDSDTPDEAPDFRLLHASRSHGHHTIPRRGEKDFEPHGTSTQQSTLDASLDAMIETLSGLRVHLPKAHITACHDTESGRSFVEHPKGLHFLTAGKTEQSGVLSLLQEESLYLLERGSLDERASESYPGSDPMPYSLQQTYSTLEDISLDAYLVYSALKRSGYIAMRASESPSLGSARNREVTSASHQKLSVIGTFTRLLSRWTCQSETSSTLLQPGLFRHIHDVQRLLSIVPFHDPRQNASASSTTQAGDAVGQHSEASSITNPALLRTTFHVWKPRHGFRKSAPGKPNFHIAVRSTNESSCPKLWELDKLLENPPETRDPKQLGPKVHVYSKLRNRESCAIIAVVDQGIISYVKITDAQFGREQLSTHVQRGSGTKGHTKTRRADAKAR